MSSSSKPLVHVLMLTYNGKQWIEDCVKTVLANDYENFKLIVVDNASTDECYKYVEENHPDVELMKLTKNVGYAGGMNQAIRKSLKEGADYLYLLNQDTKMDEKNISSLIDFYERHKSDYGILSPVQYDYDGKELDVNYVDILKKHGDSKEEVIDVPKIVGAAMMVSREAIEKVGLFDEMYFCYGEDTEFCRRMIQSNYKIGCLKKSILYHWHNLIRKDTLDPKLQRKYFVNRLVLQLKDHDRSILGNYYYYYNHVWKERSEAYGFLTGIKEVLRFVYYQLPVIIRLPRIYTNRRKEMQGGAYINA